jgi:uncharacterized protein YbbC (DUF1343 family)
MDIVRIFAPEHGFRGDHGAGETVADGKDIRTGIPLVSLYGKNKKPSPAMLADVDCILFDIQDVGARFYTYISTMHCIMEAAAENGKEVIILDRPNPNGFYIDGPVLKPEFRSFVGMHQIPVVHGCTVGELAGMINGEGWLADSLRCDLRVITCDGYAHDSLYICPVPPSPNLTSPEAIYMYPSLCFFEGTIVSVGRGTDLPFCLIGYPGCPSGKITFTPRDIPGTVTDPLYEGETCKGHDLTAFGSIYFTSARRIYLDWLISMYHESDMGERFFSSPGFFDKLAGTDELRKQVTTGMSADEISRSWQDDLERYRQTRRKYLLYPDFTE